MKTKAQFSVSAHHSIGRAVCTAAALLLLAITINSQAQYNYTTLSVPGAQRTCATGISGNTIVGYYYDGSTYQGFLYNGSSYATLSVPGAWDTHAHGISGNNIVGVSSLGAFLYNGSTYTILSVPGAQETSAYGVSGNNIVGYYYNGSTFEGFFTMATAMPP
jgi:hypothetical protein